MRKTIPSKNGETKMKKIVIACDSFKESASAIEVCQAIKNGMERCSIPFETVLFPLADGGEGTKTVLNQKFNGTQVELYVNGPLQENVKIEYILCKEESIAIMDVASVCGLDMVPVSKRNPYQTTSYGLGEMILDSIDKGAKTIYVGLGGSCTNDGGFGLLRALGVKFFDKNQKEIKSLNELENLSLIDMSQVSKVLDGIKIIGLSDVQNPLLGSNGATRMFAAQKGATSDQIETLEKILNHYSEVFDKIGYPYAQFPGAGAAGGIGMALYCIGAEIKSGIDTILELLDFKTQIRDADYIITGEGGIDDQTICGKTISGVLKYSRLYNIPVIGFAGRIAIKDETLYEHGIKALFSIVNEAKTLEESCRDCQKQLIDTAFNVGNLIL